MDFLNIIAALAGIISTVIAVLEYFKVKQKNKELEQEVRNIASTGVALGYYYNFVADIFTKLKEAKLKIKIYKEGTTETETVREFDTDDVRLQVIMPNSLKIESINKAIATMRTHRKGDIISKGTNRNFGINFRFDGVDKIIILDFPKPLNAIREHLLLDPQFAGGIGKDGKLRSLPILDSEAWKKAEQEELENFKDTIYELMRRGGIDEKEHKIEFANVSIDEKNDMQQ